MSLRTCSILYILTLLLNVFVCVFLYLDMTSLPPPQAHTARVPSCNCPSLPAAEDITCPTPPSLALAPSVHTKEQQRVGNSEHYLLVVMVLSSPKGRERRDTIRQTWMKGHTNRRQNVLIKFAVGMEGLATSDAFEIRVEESIHHDLLLLDNLKDSYYNLTLKVLVSFTKMETTLNFSYLLKCDDDTFVVLDTVLEELAQRSTSSSLYWGYFDGRAHVKRKGKWAEKNWFLCDRYLPYALGGGYILSHDLIQRIVRNANGLLFYNSEDVSVGVWLSPYTAERRHDVRFNTEFVSRGCRNQYIVSHKQSSEEMVAKQKLLETRGVQCEREFQTRMSYMYNWSTDPTKCCERRKDVV